MQPVSLEKMDVEQVEVQSTSRRGNSPSEASMDEEEELQKALRLSLGETMSQDFQQQSELPIGCQAYEDFVGYLFSSIVELLPSVLKRDRCGHQVGPLIRLLLDLVRHSRHEDAKNDRTKRFAKELAHGVSHILMLGTVQSKLPQDRIITLVTCLRAFTNLLVPEADSQYYMAGSQPDDHGEEQRPTKQKDKTNPQFVCEVHNIPAVRRRCARGPHKDRRFYVCGKERGQRCKYFVWATEIEAKPEEKPKASSHFHDVIKGLLWSHSPTGSLPLHVRLCRLLEDEVFGEEGDECDVSLSMASTSNDKKTKNNPLKSFYSIQDMERDFADGVFCSREKLQDTVSGENAVKTEATGTRELLMPVGTQGDRGALLLEASLDLLTLIADHQTEGISRWFSLLCEINISSNKPSSLRALAKKVLQSLCGGKRSLYHSVRDHFAFGFQLKSLYFHSSPVLVAALIVKEKARQCSVDWARIDNVSWSTIGVGDLIGTDDLISENDYTQMCAKKLGKVLDELWSVINKNRGESWRRFCGLRSLPHSHREIKKSGQGSKHGEAECSLAATSPIVALFWIACALNGTNQVLMFRLVDFALTNWKERKSVHRKSQESSSEGEGANDGNEDEEAMTVAEESLSVPEEILLNGERKLTVDGIVAFAISFVYGGRTLELRRVAFHVIVKLCCKLSAENQGLVFQRLIALPLSELGHMGKTSVEFLNLLQSLCRSFDTSVPVREAADFVMNCFVQQMNAVKYDRSNGEWAVLEYGSGVSTVKKKFDLSPCLYCCRPHHLRIKEPTHKSLERREAASTSRGTSGSNSGGGTRSTSSPTSSRSQSQKKWHTNQVCNYARGRIDNWKDSSASNEFCSFYSLKYRLVVSDIHLTVNDPRGRFVKTITVYFTPRPATEVSRLKSADFEERWQKCATINLPRGASRASASLAQPVLAANMKLEFSDFYERPGGSKASDGSMLVHCPRCTRGKKKQSLHFCLMKGSNMFCGKL